MEINDLKIYVMNATAIAVSMTDHIVVNLYNFKN